MARLSVRSSIERRIERELERAEGAGGRALLAKERAAAAKGPLREILLRAAELQDGAVQVHRGIVELLRIELVAKDRAIEV